MNYKKSSFICKSEKECSVFDLFIDEACCVKYKNNASLIGGCVFLVFCLIVSIDWLKKSNELANLMFWLIPCVVCFLLFFLTQKNLVIINSKFGKFEFVDNKDTYQLFCLLKEDWGKYAEFAKTLTKETFNEKLALLMEEYRQNPQNKTEYAAKCVPELLKYSCPICNKRKVENVLFINKIYSLVITSRTSSQIVAGCKKCLKEEIKRATVFSFFFGWWSVPLGLLLTPCVLISNLAKLLSLRKNEPSKDFFKLVLIKLTPEKPDKKSFWRHTR